MKLYLRRDYDHVLVQTLFQAYKEYHAGVTGVYKHKNLDKSFDYLLNQKSFILGDIWVVYEYTYDWVHDKCGVMVISMLGLSSNLGIQTFKEIRDYLKDSLSKEGISFVLTGNTFALNKKGVSNILKEMGLTEETTYFKMEI